VELSHPLAVVTPTLDGDVLAAMAQHDVSFTTGQLHRIMPRYSKAGIRKVLMRLTHQGIVDSERVGNAFSYRFNREHLAAGPIMELAALQRTLLSRIEERLQSWAFTPVYAALFGSAARGTMTPDSDLDLLLVRADGVPHLAWDQQVAALASDVTRWTGNDARPLEYSVNELAGARTEPVLHDVRADGLTLAGNRAWLTSQLRPQAG